MKASKNDMTHDRQLTGNSITACAYMRSANPTTACAYMRSATNDNRSIAVQRKVLLGMAKREGYKIIIWYVDEGLTGSGIGKRPGWLKLMSDAPTAKWEVILCSNRSRFSRFDTIEEAFVKQKLKELKKNIHTADEGLLDWNTSIGRIIDTIGSEEGNYLARIGRASLEGRLLAFRRGNFITGKCPYGYVVLVTDPQGNTHQISRKQHCSVPKGWLKILIPGETEEVGIVQWLFENYASTEVTFASLAIQLKDKGAPPCGGEWRASTIVRLLASDIYVGDTRFGRRSSGKFARLADDEVVKADRVSPNEQQGNLVRRNTHVGIISRELWDRVQAKLNKAKNN